MSFRNLTASTRHTSGDRLLPRRLPVPRTSSPLRLAQSRRNGVSRSSSPHTGPSSRSCVRSTLARGKESALFIGTQFSNLYTAVDASHGPRGCVFGVCVLGVCWQVCARTFSGLSAIEPPVIPPPAPWLSHFAACLPDLPQTPP
jgi:hypothetical protein